VPSPSETEHGASTPRPKQRMSVTWTGADLERLDSRAKCERIAVCCHAQAAVAPSRCSRRQGFARDEARPRCPWSNDRSFDLRRIPAHARSVSCAQNCGRRSVNALDLRHRGRTCRESSVSDLRHSSTQRSTLRPCALMFFFDECANRRMRVQLRHVTGAVRVGHRSKVMASLKRVRG